MKLVASRTSSDEAKACLRERQRLTLETQAGRQAS